MLKPVDIINEVGAGYRWNDKIKNGRSFKVPGWNYVQYKKAKALAIEKGFNACIVETPFRECYAYSGSGGEMRIHITTKQE